MFHTVVDAAFWVGLLVGLVFLWRTRFDFHDRRRVVVFGLAWVLIGTYEHWVLGGKSFLSMWSELDYSLSGYLALASRPEGVKFAHGFAGGTDYDVVMAFTGQVVSLERFLATTLPLGLSAIVHKVLLLGLAFVGMYRLSRGFPGIGRRLSVANASFFSVFSAFLTSVSWAHGLGYALIPLICHLVIGRLGRRFYYTGVAAVGVFHAISNSPTHTFVALTSVLFCVALLRSWSTALKIIPAFLVIFALLLLNWHEGLFAKVISSPLMARGNEIKLPYWPSLDFRLWLGIAAGVMSLYGRLADGVRIAVVLIIINFSGVIGHYLVLNVGFLAPLKPLTTGYFIAASHVVTLVALGMGTILAQARTRRSEPEGWAFKPLRHAPYIAFVAVAVLAIGEFTKIRVYNPLVWLSQGGLPVLGAALDQLKSPSWLPPAPTRTVSIHYRMAANFAAAAGLDTFDGALNLAPGPHLDYWRQVIDSDRAYSSHPGLPFVDVDFKCCEDYDINTFADVDLLRVANVGFILSIVPLKGEGLTQVAGPVGKADLPRGWQSEWERIRRFSKLVFEPAKIRVYSLGQPVARVYAAETLIRAPAGVDNRSFYALVKRHGLQGAAVARTGDIPKMAVPAGKPRLGKWRLDGDTVHVPVTGGGLVVFNTSYLPFWRAYADGRETPVFPVNGAQMAAIVPYGARQLEFRYQRPTLRQSLGNKW